MTRPGPGHSSYPPPDPDAFHGIGTRLSGPGQSPSTGGPFPLRPWQLQAWPPPAPRIDPALPEVPREYHEFYRTPGLRWWKPVAALAMAAGAWLLASLAVIGIALGYEYIRGTITLEGLSANSFPVTPVIFLANNISLALGIPIAYLTQWAVFGQRPRWLSSVTGGFRWAWFARVLALALVPYLALLTFEAVFRGALDGLAQNQDTLFLIVAILLTTPLQAAGEEFLIRGLLTRAVGAHLPRIAGLVVAAAISAAVFMALHAAGDPWLNAFYVLFAVVGSVLVWRTGGLEAAVALHVVNNLVSMVGLPFSDISEMFDREAGTGDAGVLIQMALILLVAGLILWAGRRRGLVRVSAPGAPRTPPVYAQFNSTNSARTTT